MNAHPTALIADDEPLLRGALRQLAIVWPELEIVAEARNGREAWMQSSSRKVHRSVVVNLRAISHVKQHDNETADIHLKGRDEVLPVRRHYLHLFRQM